MVGRMNSFVQFELRLLQRILGESRLDLASLLTLMLESLRWKTVVNDDFSKAICASRRRISCWHAWSCWIFVVIACDWEIFWYCMKYIFDCHATWRWCPVFCVRDFGFVVQQREASVFVYEKCGIAYDDMIEEDELLECLFWDITFGFESRGLYQRHLTITAPSSLDGPVETAEVAESRRWGRDWRSNSGHVQDVVKETTKEDVS